jgi:hypothetical protein
MHFYARRPVQPQEHVLGFNREALCRPQNETQRIAWIGQNLSDRATSRENRIPPPPGAPNPFQCLATITINSQLREIGFVPSKSPFATSADPPAPDGTRQAPKTPLMGWTLQYLKYTIN